MMKTRVLAVSVLWLWSCAEGPQGPQGPQGPAGPAWTVGSGLELSGEELRARYGTAADSVVAGNDARLSDARVPLPGSDAYVRNGVELQPGQFALAGTGHTAGSFTSQTRLEVDAGVAANSETVLLQVLNTDLDAPSFLRRPLVQVTSSGTLHAGGALGLGGPPPSGTGPRMVWYPGKAAFRAGLAQGGQWDLAQLGPYSSATGFNTVASGAGSAAGGQGSMALGNTAFAFGHNSVAEGSSSLAMGQDNDATGFSSVALGSGNIVSGTNSVALGRNNVASGSYSMALGSYASTGGNAGSFVFGDNSASTLVTAGGNNQFLVRAAGGFRFRTNATLSTGCDLPANSGAFSCTSDRNQKEDLRSVDAETLLSRVSALPIQSWRYREEDSGTRHLGPMAQDFRAAFGLGSDELSIGLLDIAGVNMVAIQALERRTQQLQEKTAEVELLKAKLERLERAVSRLERAAQE